MKWPIWLSYPLHKMTAERINQVDNLNTLDNVLLKNAGNV